MLNNELTKNTNEQTHTQISKKEEKRRKIKPNKQHKL